MGDAVAEWASVLTGRAGGEWWVRGEVPPLGRERLPDGRIMPGNRTWRGTCPGGKLFRPSPWDSAPLCHPFWPTEPSCRALSVGIGNEWTFEDLAANGGDVEKTPMSDARLERTRRLYVDQAGRAPPLRCAVHAFDATVGLRSKHEAHGRLAAAAHSDLHFHFGGLRGGSGGAGKDAARAVGESANGTSSQGNNTRNTYGEVDFSSLQTLDQLLRVAAGSEAADDGSAPAVDILKIDCEGCEWAALEHVAKVVPTLLARTRLVLLELHVATSMVRPTPTNFVGLFDLLLVRLGFRLFYVRNNPGRQHDRNVVPFLLGKALPRQCCYEIALVRNMTLRRRPAA